MTRTQIPLEATKGAWIPEAFNLLGKKYETFKKTVQYGMSALQNQMFSVCSEKRLKKMFRLFALLDASRLVVRLVDMKAAEKHKEICDKHHHASQPLSPQTEALKAKIEHQSLLNTFDTHELPLPSDPESWVDFATLSKTISKYQVTRVTSRVLDVILKTNGHLSAKRARVFLSAYMILMCTSDILPDQEGEKEQELYMTAKNMLLQFEHWKSVCQHGSDAEEAEAREKVLKFWLVYAALFDAWKSKDQHDLVAGMSAYYLELVRLQLSLGEDGTQQGVNENMKSEMPSIRDKIHRLGGQEALQRLDQEEQALHESYAAQHMHSDDGKVTDAAEIAPGQGDDEEKLNVNQVTEILDRYSSAAYDMTNLKLAHELIIDPEFKLQKQTPKTDLERRVKAMATKAFFDKLEGDYESGEWKAVVSSVVGEVRERLLDLTSPRSKEYAAVAEELNTDLVEQRLESGILDLDNVLEFVVSIMSKICAPVRDTEIQAIHEKTRGVEKLRAILESLENISLDLANYRLNELRPEILKSTVEYERCKFEELLKNGHITFDRTRSWIGNAVRELQTTANERNPEQLQLVTKISTDAAFHTAFVSFVTGPELISENNTPETLIMDTQRMADYQNELHAITAVAALLMLSRNFGASKEALSTELPEKFFHLLEDHSTTTEHIATAIALSINATPEKTEMIHNMVDKTMSQKDPVYSLLARRVSACILSHLQSGRAPSDAALVRSGLQYVGKQLQGISQKIYTLAQHHHQVFSPWYNEIVQGIQSDEPETTPTPEEIPK